MIMSTTFWWAFWVLGTKLATGTKLRLVTDDFMHFNFSHKKPLWKRISCTYIYLLEAFMENGIHQDRPSSATYVY